MSSIITEKELLVGDLNALTYTEIYAGGENTEANKMVIRNTLTTERIILRFNKDDSQILTVEPNGTDQFILGGVGQLRGAIIEAKLATSVPASLRINLFN